ncbi:MAG: TIGR03936 family radical SAM-associated protein [Planctomycetes bacterium]|nr:TIGR03936 family radical SAM-associated protein [Planctomycetota bacterium]MCW8135029.1 TIGR03936 family radical SAM-associated protein [Planctomycetota bacterium]
MAATRYRMRFEKRGALRFISHHDLMRVFELALRRSGLPVAYTQGFNPHPKVSFAIALPLGVESLDEIVDIDIAHEQQAPAPQDVLDTLAAQMPPGLHLKTAQAATARPEVIAQDFECELPPGHDLEDLGQKLQAFLAESSRAHTRARGARKAARNFDARRYTLAASLDGDLLRMRLKSGNEGGMKPSDLLEILGLDPNRLLVTKTRTVLADEATGEDGR